MELVKYDEMVRAIAICESVDEVKDIRDKAIALEVYARQAKNKVAERKCATIRVRAERQCGLLLKDTKKARGGWNAGDQSCGSSMAPQDEPKTLSEMGLSKKESAQFQKLAEIPEDIFDERIQAVLEEDSNKPTASKIINNTRGTTGSGENEWYTPQEYIEAARNVLGEFDLDPASTEFANRAVKARKYFSIDNDGLTQSWSGKLWVNPPYAQPYIAQFMVKLVDEYSSGNVIEAIALTHNYTDTKWFHCAQAAAASICFTRGRVSFINPAGEKAAPTQGQAFFYGFVMVPACE